MTTQTKKISNADINTWRKKLDEAKTELTAIDSRLQHVAALAALGDTSAEKERSELLAQRDTKTQQYSTWFRNLEVKEITPERVVMTVPSQFHRDWIATYYREVLERSVREVLREPREVCLDVAPPRPADGNRPQFD